MKAFIEVEYIRSNWSYKLSFTRAQEANTTEGKMLLDAFELMKAKFASEENLASEVPALTVTLDKQPAVAEVVAVEAPVVEVAEPVTAEVIEAVTADPFAEAPKPKVVKAVKAKLTKE